jgi:hypothetical protein
MIGLSESCPLLECEALSNSVILNGVIARKTTTFIAIRFITNGNNWRNSNRPEGIKLQEVRKYSHLCFLTCLSQRN